jgi:regulatory protein
MVIEEVLGKLKEQGLVDDLSFAIFWKESRQNFNPRSRRLVQKELRDKGISPEMAMEVTRDWDEEQAAYRAARKKVRMLKGQDFQTFRQKLAGFLRRRGFSWEITRNTIERLWREGIS